MIEEYVKLNTTGHDKNSTGKATHLLIILTFAYSISYFMSLSGISQSGRSLNFFSCVFFFWTKMKEKVPSGTLVISFPSVLASPHVFFSQSCCKHGRWRKKYLQILCYCKCQNVQGYKWIINHRKGLSWQSIKGKVFLFLWNYLFSNNFFLAEWQHWVNNYSNHWSWFWNLKSNSSKTWCIITESFPTALQY